jgi:hypothetical protein
LAVGDFSLREDGSFTSSLIETGNTVAGWYDRTTAGSDTYSMSEQGKLIGGTFTESVLGQEGFTVTETGNTDNQTYDRTTTGTGTATVTETGAGTLGSGSSSYGYTLGEDGDSRAGMITQNEFGGDRYGLLERFVNVATIIPKVPGNMDYFPFGEPFADANYGEDELDASGGVVGGKKLTPEESRQIAAAAGQAAAKPPATKPGTVLSNLGELAVGIGEFGYDVIDTALEPVRIGGDLMRCGGVGIYVLFGGEAYDPGFRANTSARVKANSNVLETILELELEHAVDSGIGLLTYGALKGGGKVIRVALRPQGGFNMLPFIHEVPKNAAGASTSQLFERIARDPAFLRIAGVTEEEMLAALDAASVRYSNVLQAGYAGRVPLEGGGDQLVLGLSRLHQRTSPAAHELFHLAREMRGGPSLRIDKLPSLATRIAEESRVWGMQLRYAPVGTIAEAGAPLVVIYVGARGANALANRLLE